MIRAQCLVHRGNKILMVKHRMEGVKWWCLPGGGVKPNETPSEAAVRELMEECCVTGKILTQTGQWSDGSGTDMVTFLIDIGTQNPHMGIDPEFYGMGQILVDVQWMALAELPERDRAYLWAAGLMSVPEFLEEMSDWGDEVSYPAR